MTLFLRRTIFAFALGAALATAVFVGRAAHATTGVIDACFKPSNGTLYLLGEGTGRTECQPGDIPISWSTTGVNGQDGVSVTSESLAPGDDAACPNGGSRFTAVDGVTYACNGSNGVDGQDGQDGVDGENGQDGQDGEDFSGTFASPNGLFKLIVDDTTARIEGPGGKVQITASGVQLDTFGTVRLVSGPTSLNLSSGSISLGSPGSFSVNSSSGSTFNSLGPITIHSNALFSASGAVTSIGGTPIILNGQGCGVVRTIDVNPFIPPTGGPTLLNPNGSPTVRTTC